MSELKDLRSFLTLLEERGQLAHVEKEVDPKHEIAAVMLRSALADGPALFFKNVKGHKFPAVANIGASRLRMAWALGQDMSTVRGEYRRRIENPLPPTLDGQGICQQVITEQVDLAGLPIITAHEHDVGPYITAGVVIARHPTTGVYNLSLHRTYPKGKDRAVMVMSPNGDLWAYYNAYGKTTMPVAIAIGLHPSFLLAAAVKFPISVDEYAIVGSLREQPVQLVKCKTIDLEVPASAEIVLEGEITPGELDWEGPFGEYPGYYGGGTLQPTQSPVVNFKAMTTRKDPIYQALITGPTLGHESAHFSSLAKEGLVFSAAKGVCDFVSAVNITLSRYIAVIQVRRGFVPGDIGLIMAAAFSSMDYLKHVIVVDDDVDIDSYADVFWAISTRMDPTKDLYIIPKQRMTSLDPSTPGVCDKVGMDATIPIGKEAGFIRTRIPGYENINLEDYIKRLT